jgi:hypothetical protein
LAANAEGATTQAATDTASTRALNRLNVFGAGVLFPRPFTGWLQSLLALKDTQRMCALSGGRLPDRKQDRLGNVVRWARGLACFVPEVPYRVAPQAGRPSRREEGQRER